MIGFLIVILINYAIGWIVLFDFDFDDSSLGSRIAALSMLCFGLVGVGLVVLVFLFYIAFFEGVYRNLSRVIKYIAKGETE